MTIKSCLGSKFMKNEISDLILALQQGTELIDRQVDEIDVESAFEEPDFVSIAKLLGFYRAHKSSLPQNFHELQLRIVRSWPNEQIAWLAMTRAGRIQKTDLALYTLLVKEWVSHLRNNMLEISGFITLSNFLVVNGDENFATIVLEEGLQRLPSSEQLSDQRAQLIGKRCLSGADDLEPLQAFEYIEESLNSENDSFKKFSKIIMMLDLSFKIENQDKVEPTARNLLLLADDCRSDSANYGYALHKAHTALGNLALNKKNEDLACSHLIKSVEIPPSFCLSVAGPDLSLAKALLERGRLVEISSFIGKCKGLDLDQQHLRNINQLFPHDV